MGDDKPRSIEEGIEELIGESRLDGEGVLVHGDHRIMEAKAALLAAIEADRAQAMKEVEEEAEKGQRILARTTERCTEYRKLLDADDRVAAILKAMDYQSRDAQRLMDEKERAEADRDAAREWIREAVEILRTSTHYQYIPDGFLARAHIADDDKGGQGSTEDPT